MSEAYDSIRTVATEAELGQWAVDLAQQTSWSWDKYLSEVRNNPSYQYKNTAWYKAGGKLEEAKHLPPPPQPPVSDLTSVQARIFLANDPLNSLAAPSWMVPVCTADEGYQNWYTAETISQLRNHFGKVEAWCDCRNPTAFSEAVGMVERLSLNGPAWGQCETTAELQHGYEQGARRFVGNCDPNVMNDTWLNRVKSGEILMTVELYRNKMPWMLPDWRNANAGIGGNCIAGYESETEGATYYPVSRYKDEGLYSSGSDSIYGVGLKPEDWAAL
jgi:hypothetical protein